MAVIGYARVSTVDQTLDMQCDELREAGATTIYQDKASGKSFDRPEFSHCLKALREGDTLLVWRLDRLGRNAQELIRIVNDLAVAGVKLRSLHEAVDTSGPTGKLVLQMFAVLAEFERELVVERTRAGLAAARARGRKGGRPPRLAPAQRRAALAMMRDREMSVAEICRHFGISRSTLYSVRAAGSGQSE